MTSGSNYWESLLCVIWGTEKSRSMHHGIFVPSVDKGEAIHRFKIECVCITSHYEDNPVDGIIRTMCFLPQGLE